VTGRAGASSRISGRFHRNAELQFDLIERVVDELGVGQDSVFRIEQLAGDLGELQGREQSPFLKALIEFLGFFKLADQPLSTARSSSRYSVGR